jgi:redox-sensitive bicupin YhaK (pirin superfamily)
MITQSKGKIFLANERGLTETTWFRSLNTFNFGSYQREHKKPFGSLYVLNEDTLDGGKSLKWLVEENTDVILLPVVGAIEFSDNNGNAGILKAGMVHLLSLPSGGSYEVKNPYPDHLVKYLQIWIKTPTGKTYSSFQSTFDLGNYQLIDLFDAGAPKNSGYSGAIIKLNGRQEDTYYKKLPANGVFVYSIQGALEVQYRLLHEGDGLALWDADEIDFEALSNNAILLIIEVPLQ